MKHILRYLSGTITYGLLFSPASHPNQLSLRAYIDSDWSDDLDDRRSTSGSCLYFGPNLVAWSSKKQLLVACSSTKVEYRTLAHITLELFRIESLLAELYINYFTPTLLCDNLSAILLSHNPMLHARTKHIEFDIHFVREKIVVGKLNIQHVPGHAHIADMITKPLSTALFHEF